MKTTQRFLTYAVMAFALIFTSYSCEGEDGEDGINGIDGLEGSAGEDGNANVDSVTFDAYFVEIGQNELDIPELTQEIFDNGVVLGYVTVNGNQFWETLPVVLSGSRENVIDIDRIEVGKIILTSTFSQTLNFRFILIQGNAINAIDFNDFGELQAYYDLD